MIAGVPKGLRRQVRDAFVNALKVDPKLSNNRVIKTWLTWDGTAPIADPAEAAMPAVMVMMLGGPVVRKATTRAPGGPMTYVNQSTIAMIVTLWTEGTDQGDNADVADLIVSALDPQGVKPRSELQEKFRVAGIKDWQLVREILPMSMEGFSQESIMGQGSYDLTVFFNS